MKKVNAIIMNYNEFEELVGKVSGGHAGIGFGSREWFYVADDEYDCDNINKDLSEQLGATVKLVRIDRAADKDDVIIICE